MWGQMGMWEGREGVRRSEELFARRLRQPQDRRDARPTRLCRHAAAISPIKADGGGNIGKSRRVALSIVRWLFAVGGLAKLRRRLESARNCSETEQGRLNMEFYDDILHKPTLWTYTDLFN